MKANQILKALNLAKNKPNSDHCAKLSLIYEHIKSISTEIKNVSFDEIECNFGRETEKYWQYNELKTRVKNEGKKMPAHKFKIETLTGCYEMTIPTNNEFYNSFVSLLPNFENKMQPMQIDDSICDLLINLPDEATNDFKQALKFVGKDYLRPAMQCVLLNLNNGKCNIVATDAHKLFESETYIFDDSLEMQILINANDLKAILASKSKSMQIEVYSKPGTSEIDFCIANGVKFNPIEAKFPNYKAVIPEYANFMEFERKEFINKVSIAKLSANRVTKQVNFHLNGSIAISANDYDFNQGSKLDMPYISKNFVDTDITFNAGFLIDSVNVFNKSKNVQMFTDGMPLRPVLIKSSECKSTVLLMPIVSNI